jgi:hypothetical protein
MQTVTKYILLHIITLILLAGCATFLTYRYTRLMPVTCQNYTPDETITVLHNNINFTATLKYEVTSPTLPAPCWSDVSTATFNNPRLVLICFLIAAGSIYVLLLIHTIYIFKQNITNFFADPENVYGMIIVGALMSGLTIITIGGYMYYRYMAFYTCTCDSYYPNNNDWGVLISCRNILVPSSPLPIEQFTIRSATPTTCWYNGSLVTFTDPFFSGIVFLICWTAFFVSVLVCSCKNNNDNA